MTKRVECPRCRAGRIDCHECRGRGAVECGDCRGRRTGDCTWCHGTGVLSDGSLCDRLGCRGGQLDCPRCQGRGEVDCPARCDRGQVDCATCQGRGYQEVEDPPARAGSGPQERRDP